MTKAEIELGPPSTDELDDLNAMILRSKAYWGYDEAFMRACETELKVTAQLLAQNQFVTATANGNIAGMAEVSFESDRADLEKLFVEPDHMRLGVGRLLFEWAILTAKTAGALKIVIEADPDAEPFYRKMGAKRVGMAPSGSIPGRQLPELEFRLD